MYDDILGKQESKKTRGTLVERLIDEPLKKSKRTLKKTNLKPPTPALIEEDDDDDGSLIEDDCGKCDGGCVSGSGYPGNSG